MVQVIPLRFGTVFKKAFSDTEVFSAFAGDVLGLPIRVDAVQQEYRYPAAVGPVNVTYDLFAEDTEHRLIVEVQHIRERDFFERFLHYHLVGIVEQVTSHATYRTARTVCTVVVLTTAPRDESLRFSVASSDMDPVNEKGARLGVYRHRLVFLNPRDINPDTPPAARRWLELFADSLDGQVEESLYPDPVLKRVIGAIRNDTISPDDLARLKDEAAWEETKREERDLGRAEGLREARAAIVDMCELLGIALSPAQREHLASLDLDGLSQLRGHLKQHQAWPG